MNNIALGRGDMRGLWGWIVTVETVEHFRRFFSGYSGGIPGSEGVSECQGRQGFEQIATCVGQSLQHTQPHSYLRRITTVFPHMKGPRECIFVVETYFANEETCAASCEQRQRLLLVCRIRRQLAN